MYWNCKKIFQNFNVQNFNETGIDIWETQNTHIKATTALWLLNILFRCAQSEIGGWSAYRRFASRHAYERGLCEQIRRVLGGTGGNHFDAGSGSHHSTSSRAQFSMNFFLCGVPFQVLKFTIFSANVHCETTAYFYKQNTLCKKCQLVAHMATIFFASTLLVLVEGKSAPKIMLYSVVNFCILSECRQLTNASLLSW